MLSSPPLYLIQNIYINTDNKHIPYLLIKLLQITANYKKPIIPFMLKKPKQQKSPHQIHLYKSTQLKQPYHHIKNKSRDHNSNSNNNSISLSTVNNCHGNSGTKNVSSMSASKSIYLPCDYFHVCKDQENRKCNQKSKSNNKSIDKSVKKGGKDIREASPGCSECHCCGLQSRRKRVTQQTYEQSRIQKTHHKIQQLLGLASNIQSKKTSIISNQLPHSNILIAQPQQQSCSQHQNYQKQYQRQMEQLRSQNRQLLKTNQLLLYEKQYYKQKTILQEVQIREQNRKIGELEILIKGRKCHQKNKSESQNSELTFKFHMENCMGNNMVENRMDEYMGNNMVENRMEDRMGNNMGRNMDNHMGSRMENRMQSRSEKRDLSSGGRQRDFLKNNFNNCLRQNSQQCYRSNTKNNRENTSTSKSKHKNHFFDNDNQNPSSNVKANVSSLYSYSHGNSYPQSHSHSYSNALPQSNSRATPQLSQARPHKLINLAQTATQKSSLLVSQSQQQKQTEQRYSTSNYNKNIQYTEYSSNNFNKESREGRMPLRDVQNFMYASMLDDNRQIDRTEKQFADLLESVQNECNINRKTTLRKMLAIKAMQLKKVKQKC